MIPYRDNGHLTARQTYFNTVLSSLRQIVERTIRLLIKGRWRKLQHMDHLNLELIVQLIISACVLHNPQYAFSMMTLILVTCWMMMEMMMTMMVTVQIVMMVVLPVVEIILRILSLQPAFRKKDPFFFVLNNNFINLLVAIIGH